MLYYVAISAPVGPQVQAVQRAFRLSGLIPTRGGAQRRRRAASSRCCAKRASSSRGAKDAWLKFASGRAENLPKLKATLASVHTKAAEIKHGALMKLTSALVERLDKMPSSGVSETLAMEYATALLLAESAFENYANARARLPEAGRRDARAPRRRARGPRDRRAAAPMLDEMSKRAQERVLLAQVGREIQANLRHMEQVLDAFFRDNGKRADLATLTKDSQQIRGALAILGLDDAERLLGVVPGADRALRRTRRRRSTNDDLEILAESLSGLGFYIEAVEQQRPDRERLIAPLIAKRLGEAPAPEVEERDSVEDAVARAARRSCPRCVDEVAPRAGRRRRARGRCAEARGAARRRRADRRRGARRRRPTRR